MMENHSSCSYKQEKEVLKLDSMPLAMTYVPWQKWQNIYKPENALAPEQSFRNLTCLLLEGGARNDAEYAFFSKLHYAKL